MREVTLGLTQPKFDHVVLGHVTPAISLPNYFFTSKRPLLITFATKFYLLSTTFISYKFCAGYIEKSKYFFF